MTAVTFAAVAILRCASADSVTTSILLPDALIYTDGSFQKPTFVGRVNAISSTTYYTLDCLAGGAGSYFIPRYDECYSYTFSEISGRTCYLLEA